MTEPELIAQHLAGSPWFPLPAPQGPVAVRDSAGHAEADGNTVRICVTDADGTKREYQAKVVLVPDNGAPEDFSLLAPVAVPAGVTAGQWRTHESGRLVRDLSDGTVQEGHGGIFDAAGHARVEPNSVQCQHCTVPVDSGDICTFCSTYVPPAQPGPQQ